MTNEELLSARGELALDLTGYRESAIVRYFSFWGPSQVYGAAPDAREKWAFFLAAELDDADAITIRELRICLVLAHLDLKVFRKRIAHELMHVMRSHNGVSIPHARAEEKVVTEQEEGFWPVASSFGFKLPALPIECRRFRRRCVRRAARGGGGHL